MCDRYDRLLETCSIALVGKYTKFSDSYASVIKALEHSALAINHKLEIKVREGVGTMKPSALGDAVCTSALHFRSSEFCRNQEMCP